MSAALTLQHDYFSSFSQSDNNCFLALSLPSPSFLLKLFSKIFRPLCLASGHLPLRGGIQSPIRQSVMWPLDSINSLLTLRKYFQVYQDGVRNVNVVFIFRHVTLPVVTCLLLAVTIPYVIAAGIIPLIGKTYNQECIKSPS